MKYFKPELFVAFNSEDARAANRASQAWDEAVTAYDQYLKSIRRRLPAAVQKLSKLYLHDAAYLDFGEDSPSPENRVAHLTVRQDGQPLLLLYFLLESPLVTGPFTDRVFSEQAVHWLYDELELRGPATSATRFCSATAALPLPFPSPGDSAMRRTPNAPIFKASRDVRCCPCGAGGKRPRRNRRSNKGR